MIDCGWPRGAPAVAPALAAIGLAVEDLRAVLLTHGHPDHLGAAALLEPEAPIHAHADELERVRGRRPATRSPTLLLELWRPHAIRFVASSIERGVLSPHWPTQPRPLEELGDAPAVVPTPGHTEGHVAYHLPERGVVFTGDALVTLDVLTRARGPRLHPAPFQVDFERAVDTLPAIGSLDAELLLPGHGEPYRGSPAVAVDEALARRR